MKFEIFNRYSGAVQVTAEIECSERDSYSVKLGLAVRWAYKAKADLRGANLRGAYLGGAYLGGADLREANLGGAYLGGANLRGAYLGGAYLGGADLREANLGGAYLGGADLGGADLGGADLREANLGGAYLGGADLGGLILIARATRSDGHEYRAWTSVLGGMVITAGCRTWQDGSVQTPGMALTHAVNHSTHTTDKAYRAEALAILAHIERMVPVRMAQLAETET